ncbi:MAG: putative collagen-binding domain-containing protein, partial [Planctomycetota bacterium]
KAARKLESVMKLWDIEPANGLLTDRENNEAYLACNPGKTYALYFTDGGEVGLDLRKAPGRCSLRWIDIRTGKWKGDQSINGEKIVTIKAPGKGHWVAIIARK